MVGLLPSSGTSLEVAIPGRLERNGSNPQDFEIVLGQGNRRGSLPTAPSMNCTYLGIGHVGIIESLLCMSYQSNQTMQHVGSAARHLGFPKTDSESMFRVPQLV